MNALTQLCVKNKVKSLYAFGSVLTSRFDNDKINFQIKRQLQIARCSERH